MSLVRSILYGRHVASGFLSFNLNLRMQWNLETYRIVTDRVADA